MKTYKIDRKYTIELPPQIIEQLGIKPKDDFLTFVPGSENELMQFVFEQKNDWGE